MDEEKIILEITSDLAEVKTDIKYQGTILREIWEKLGKTDEILNNHCDDCSAMKEAKEAKEAIQAHIEETKENTKWRWEVVLAILGTLIGVCGVVVAIIK